MKRITVIALWVALYTCGRASPEFFESDSTRFFPFLQKGRLLSYSAEPMKAHSDAAITLYKLKNGEEIVLSGCPAGVERMLQLEFPQGVDEGFVKGTFIKLLAGCLATEDTNGILCEPGLSEIRATVSGDAGRLRLLQPPVSFCSSDFWVVRYTKVDRRGGMFLEMFNGRLRPFTIDSSTEFILCTSSGDLDVEKALLLEERADKMFLSIQGKGVPAKAPSAEGK
jgi:hypothetical protein